MPAENGYVPTPAPVADLAAGHVFGVTRPSEVEDGGRLLLPGLGTGNLYAAVRRYCTEGQNWNHPSFDYPLPSCVGVENDPERIAEFREQRSTDAIEVREADFLLDPPDGRFDWALANPPYTRYKRIDEDRRAVYRDRFTTATGQFPLYAPFVEQLLDLVKPDGSVTVILPITALTTDATAPLRRLLERQERGHVLLLPESTFDRTVRTVMLTVECDPSPRSVDHWWVENVLAYGPRPLLDRLGVADVDAATTAYMERLREAKRRVRHLTTREIETLDGSDSSAAPATGNQATLGEWSA
jgi:hypothetical protein